MFGLGFEELIIILLYVGFGVALYRTYKNIGRIADAVEKLADKK